MALVTNANNRSQSSYGSLQPRADMKRHGVAYAAIGDGGDGRWPHIDHIRTEGLQCGTSNQAVVFEEYRDAKGNTHDVTLANGMKVREMICPIEDIEAKHRIECDESQRLVDQYTHSNSTTSQNGTADHRVRLSGEVVEKRFGTADIAPEDLPTMAPGAPGRPVKGKAMSVGWTPERRARQMATIAAKKSQPATNTT